jgi:hypothetical protein
MQMEVDRKSFIVPTVDEVTAAFMDWDSADYSAAIGVLCFLLLLAVPLRQMDRRDGPSAFSYVAFCLGAGVTLVLAVPRKLGGAGDSSAHFTVVAALGSLAAIRWGMRKPEVIREVDTSAPPKKETDRR